MRCALRKSQGKRKGEETDVNNREWDFWGERENAGDNAGWRKTAWSCFLWETKGRKSGGERMLDC